MLSIDFAGVHESKIQNIKDQVRDAVQDAVYTRRHYLMDPSRHPDLKHMQNDYIGGHQ